MTITDKQILKQLTEYKNNGQTKQERARAHAILLSNNGKTAKEIAEIFAVTQRSVFGWFKDYKEDGLSSLKCKDGRGRKRILDEDAHKAIIKKHIEDYPHQPKQAYALTIEELKIAMSYDTFKRFLKRHSI
jgi:transposase